jgi:ParB family chromosome partitioning protein
MRATMNDEKLAELKESMNDLGLLDPLKVTPKDGGFEVIDGHRRLLVARELKWAGLPCLVLRNRDEVLEAIKIDCNMVREDVNAAEQAVYYQQLLDKYHLDEDSLCKLVHKGADYIADRLRLLRGDGRVFDALAANRISFAVARELNKCTDENMRRYYLDSAIRSGCASRVVTEWIANWRATAGLSSGPVTQIDTTPATNPIEVYHDCCALCGGDRDPLNLVTVRMHKWEWEQLSKAWEISAKGEQ